MDANFRVYFGRNRQFFDVFLWDVHPSTFKSWDGGYWAYVDFENQEHPRRGKFAELHAVKSRLRVDTVAHELDHLRIEWLRYKRGKRFQNVTIIPNGEERFCCIGDELTRKFWRAYARYVAGGLG